MQKTLKKSRIWDWLWGAVTPKTEPETCDCDDCLDGEKPCAMDCDAEDACRGCREKREAAMDREFDEKSTLGYL